MASPMDKAINALEWTEAEAQEPNEDGLPFVTHTGILKILDVEITVHQLSNGMRVIPSEDMAKLFGDYFLKK